MSGEKKHSTYTATDIQQYLSGQMTAAAMHAFEKAALDDPLLAEAIEGYASLQEKDWQPAMEELKQAMAQQSATSIIAMPRNRYTKWWRAAAAMLLIGSTVAMAYMFTARKNAGSTVQHNIAVVDTINIKAPDSSVEATELVIVDRPVAIEQKAATTPVTVNKPVAAAQPPTVVAALKPAQLEDEDFVYKPAPSTPKQPAGAASQEPETLSKITQQPASITNVVTNAESNNLQGNAVTNEAAEVAVLDKNVLPQQVAGRQNNIPVTDTAGVVTVVGYGTQKAKATTELNQRIENAADIPVPLGGWAAYNSYLKDNMIWPAEVKAKNIQGEVGLVVKLTGTGDIKKIKVSKALCGSCDAEAVRLVREGPKWEVKNKKVTTVTVKVVF
ncbi:MAG TPA: energy transducer TonB [Ferruginibacter sp.]|nr:energy transducer TonB [Ferruginibacter sp.]HMP20483.1 energy transducer TonB [Ferruginibacter sp.]